MGEVIKKNMESNESCSVESEKQGLDLKTSSLPLGIKLISAYNILVLSFVWLLVLWGLLHQMCCRALSFCP